MPKTRMEETPNIKNFTPLVTRFLLSTLMLGFLYLRVVCSASGRAKGDRPG